MDAQAKQPATVIVCHRKHLERRCEERGYSLSEVLPCVVSTDGDQWSVDVSSPFYPKESRSRGSDGTVPPLPPHGPGAELKAMLAGWPFYISASPDCSCNAMAVRMDFMGCDWCASPEGTAEILAAMKANAERKGIPYVEAAAKLLLRRAIKNARKKASQ